MTAQSRQIGLFAAGPLLSGSLDHRKVSLEALPKLPVRSALKVESSEKKILLKCLYYRTVLSPVPYRLYSQGHG